MQGLMIRGTITVGGHCFFLLKDVIVLCELCWDLGHCTFNIPAEIAEMPFANLKWHSMCVNCQQISWSPRNNQLEY